jgi:hypothetical protein
MDMNTKVEKLTKYHTVFTQDASDVSLTEGIIEKTEATDN